METIEKKIYSRIEQLFQRTIAIAENTEFDGAVLWWEDFRLEPTFEAFDILVIMKHGTKN